ncbi:MAG: hypothetical protein HYW57_00410 [Ignavibacteriales bacterium]|nr:hypothetical protein [Ignavibacteriales bacterium]
MENAKGYPRNLTPWEKDLLMWLLPEDRPGYRPYRHRVERWQVVAQGRRGEGNFILAPLDERVDNESPLPQVLAVGVVETPRGGISVTIREHVANQVEFEIAKLGAGELGGAWEEIRRWTLSTWSPGAPCPICQTVLRQVRMTTVQGRVLVLVICSRDEKLWVHDGETGINHPIPHTNFYNELMLRKGIRDPQTALDSKRLFTDLRLHTDADLANAFRSYNQIRTKIPMEDRIVVLSDRRRSFFGRLAAILKRGLSQG